MRVDSSLKPSRHQIHGRGAFDRPEFLRQGALQIQFHAPVRWENIRPPFRISAQLEAPIIVWGRDDRCWAFLHDFDERGIRLILDACRQATFERRGPYANPFSGGRSA